jgi:dethiobiotin synthetase
MATRARGLFIAGTDTGVGKTRVTADLVRALAREQFKVAVMKPVAAGAESTPEGLRNGDALELMSAANVAAPYGSVNPYCFAVPASPHIASQIEGIAVDLAHIQREFDNLSTRFDAQVVAVEGAGGWLAPISADTTMADVARALDVPVVLVVGLRLGCLNHALLTEQAIRACGLTFAGWIANHVQPHFEHAPENIFFLEQRLHAPLLESVAFDASAFTSVPAVRRLRDAFSLW